MPRTKRGFSGRKKRQPNRPKKHNWSSDGKLAGDVVHSRVKYDEVLKPENIEDIKTIKPIKSDKDSGWDDF